MILSGCHVLFMDPKKAYLRKGSIYKVSLEMMKRCVNHLLEYTPNIDTIC